MKRFFELVKEKNIHSNSNIEFIALSINDKKKEYYDRLKYITKHSELMNSYIYDYDIEPANKHQSMLVRVTISSIPKIEKNKVASKSTKILLVNKKKYE